MIPNLITNPYVPPINAVDPSYHGAIAWTLDPPLANASAAMGAGKLYYGEIVLRQPVFIASPKISIYIASGGATMNNCYVGLCDNTGALLSVSADQSANWTGTGTKTITLSTGNLNLAAGTYYIALLCGNGSSTPPSLQRGSGTGGVNNMICTAAAGWRFGELAGTATAIPSAPDRTTWSASALSFVGILSA